MRYLPMLTCQKLTVPLLTPAAAAKLSGNNKAPKCSLPHLTKSPGSKISLAYMSNAAAGQVACKAAAFPEQ
ncbi:hypothetical protein EMPG_12780 [Blastomyces silverae]|uniref:Uncharacterized protein n=1 Tax=Blastomyces silverae TaxID=2060906 RepID=A0A0H1BKP5_9EURO|nr:hypothetical protein EMPG_12780 [Blastomyces silverae]